MPQKNKSMGMVLLKICSAGKKNEMVLSQPIFQRTDSYLGYFKKIFKV